ncbi:MAG: class I SAM-dependent methyltransferase [Candidatus Bathyarchaeota archaeon]|nr:MAG: class I SAM-dependent methyltransferase [Candidatus Bathyarchaeota archaeon]
MTYREGAEKYYDLFGAKADGPFYIGLAKEHGGKALELGVGTARLAIQLAREGIETWGIDNSPHMLRAADANLAKELVEVRERIHLELADVRDFSLGEGFGLVYFPSFSFDHLLERADQLKALEAIRAHVAPDGVYAFDLAHVPELRADSSWFVQRKPIDERNTVVRTGHHSTDPERRLMTINLWYEHYFDGRMTERYFEGGEVYVHTPDGIWGLLTESGFKVEDWYGGHEEQEFSDESAMMVVVARPV